MAKRVLLKQRMIIPSAFLVRALARGRHDFHCRNCGERMFVQYESGLCPLCYNGQRALTLPEPLHPVPEGRALAGVLDDPTIEELTAD
jgi:hypothetical protein